MAVQATPRKTILLFGPQPLSLNQDTLNKIRASILGFPTLGWILDVVQELPDRFSDLCTAFPTLHGIPGIELLRDLQVWLETGTWENITKSSHIPNTILTPLCVISQFAAYCNFLQLERNGHDMDFDEASSANNETAGFCTGLLVALAVSLNPDRSSLENYGATVLRLAMLIGAVVDAQDVVNGGSKSFSAVWKSPEQYRTGLLILSKHPEAYVSVRYDEDRVTVTTSTKNIRQLMEELNGEGITTIEMGLRGRFHAQCHLDLMEPLNRFCALNPAYELPDASELVLPCRTDVTDTGEYIKKGRLSEITLQAMLVQPSKWWMTLKSFCSTGQDAATIVTLGQDRCLPPSIIRGLPSSFRLVHCTSYPQNPSDGHDDVAVIGMACRVAGADDLNDFWSILQRGKSQHTEVPESRFSFSTASRGLDVEKKWYGNFIKDNDAFDHRFFKKSPREAATMDPQQRLLLEVAYQAIEQSGYFQGPDPSSEVGCYIGTCAVDYEHNISSHAANSFSSTGTLRGFIAGKISHHFGWTGPGLTIDTACSGAAVAVHSACRAILGGECKTALAGGVNMITQPLAYQNLAAASFLSPSGQCKPFCLDADGYCRGEGIAAVYLKKKSAAIADGDQIFGVISGTRVDQNQNCTPIFVPNTPSLSNLFQKVLNQARLEPQQISYVEAHGTGTPVGDPAEYDSIKRVFAVSERAEALQLGSVKGLVGHTESTSGLISLVKVLLMMHENTIPPQASFRTMNTHINATNLVEISTSPKPWNETSKAALINNYGASGSNASLIITQTANAKRDKLTAENGDTYPFWFSSLDDRSLQEYVKKFRRFLDSKARTSCPISVKDLSFNLARQSNRKLNRALILSCATLDELQEKLSGDLITTEKPPSRPVILCFGGQNSTYVGLDRHVFDNTALLRSHLNTVDAVCLAMGFGSIYPHIFQRSPITDHMKLLLSLFAMQFSAARSWLDCGAHVSALVGHSFGELTALCISGILCLSDAVRMVAGRAKVIRDEWGPEKGAMLAVEGQLDQIERVIAECTRDGERSATIACFNGPRSFTLAGSVRSIDAVAQTISSNSIYASIRMKRVNVTNAYHSTLVQRIMPQLKLVARGLTFRKPAIPIEFATETEHSRPLNSDYVAEHMRSPVYFQQAVQRLSEKYPSCLWLEAGSNSTITAMANRALGTGPRSVDQPVFQFQAVNITSEGSMNHLAFATSALWLAGLNITFWPHHRTQICEYSPLILPPYQFERSRHWMELKVPVQPQPTTTVGEKPQYLWQFDGYRDAKQRSARFKVMTDAKQYKEMVSGHKIAQTAPICPATLMIDIAIEALKSLNPFFREKNVQPQVFDVSNHVPVCLDSSRVVWLEFTASAAQSEHLHHWNWKIISECKHQTSTPTTHVSGHILFCSTGDLQHHQEFARYERLVSHERCLNILNRNDANDEIIQGPNLYKVFSEIVEYGKQYQGLRKLVGSRLKNESAGHIVRQYSNETWLDAYLSDCFSQVGGIWVNCMTEKDPGDMYIANGFEKWIRSPKLRDDYHRPYDWHVLACHEKRGPSAFVTDIFIFDPRSDNLVEAILGISYARVSKPSMCKLLSRLSEHADSNSTPGSFLETNVNFDSIKIKSSSEGERKPKVTPGTQNALLPKIRVILAELSGLDADDIHDSAELADIGIDSLVGMELAREIEAAFGCALPTEVLMTVTDVHSLSDSICATLRADDSASSADESTGLSMDSSDTKVLKSTAPTSRMNSSSASDIGVNDDRREERPNEGSDAILSSNKPENVLDLPTSVVLRSFTESKNLTDRFVESYGCSRYLETVLPLQNKLCVALTLEAFKQLGCDLWATTSGQELKRIRHISSLTRLVDYLYDILVDEAGLIDRNGVRLIRSSASAPTTSSIDILKDLLLTFPEHVYPHKLAHLAGSSLAEVLSGSSDGIRVLFGSGEGRHLASGLYADSPLNKLSYAQMHDFLERLVANLPDKSRPLKILELGAGTGGTTKWIVPLLANLGIPVEYTFSDLSPSFVAAARKSFSKEYPFMKFRTLDVESTPPDDLLYSQHMVLASNAIHATHSLTKSLGNVRRILRPDGFLMMLEMTKPLYWVDMIFGLLEGWWLFDDGRRHAIAHESRWKSDLLSVGYGHVDWSDGEHPETAIQRVFLAMNNAGDVSTIVSDVVAREAMVNTYLEKYVRTFTAPPSHSSKNPDPSSPCILVTGATGSLGSHIVSHLAGLTGVKTIICLNRKSDTDPVTRQLNALESRGIGTIGFDKMVVVETDTTKPLLGLGEEQYDSLASKVTHIVHNAWPMSGKRPLKGFEAQFKIMRNLMDFASRVVANRKASLSFQFVSSIAVVGQYPIHAGSKIVPEQRMETAAAVLFNGYGDAKWVCERMLDETLHRYPQHFRTMSVRLGQIAGSKTSGYWNHMEHFSFLVKSSQTLRKFPRFEGVMSWTPINDVAASLSDLLLQDRGPPYPIYHIDNPVRQDWSDMVVVLANSIQAEIVSYDDWVESVRSYQGSVEWDNPAAKLMDFFDEDYIRMSCGGLLLDTVRACEHSESLRAVGPIGNSMVERYVQAWKDSGFLDA